MNSLTYRDAITLALAAEMDADPAVFILGEDVAKAGGVFKTTEGLLDRFGPERVLDTPISEQAIVGAAIGTAMRGLRPVAELMFADFAAVCFDQIVNQLAKHRYLTGGQIALPVTVRLMGGASLGFGAQHSQCAENWLLNVPGLKIAVPATPSDAYGLLRASIRDDNPVLVFEHKGLLNMKEQLSAPLSVGVLGRARVVRPGRHVTVVATQLMLQRALEAASRLSVDGVEVEVIDPRTLAPLDYGTIEDSVTATGRLLVVQEAPAPGSWGSTVVARVVQDRYEDLDAAPVLLSSDETPIPYAGNLEAAWMPSTERIAQAVGGLLAA